MRERLIALRERRAHLVAQAQMQRTGVLAMVERAELAMAWVDRASAVAHWMRGQPVLIAAGVALLVVLRPRKALKWFATGVSLWRTWKSLRPVIERLAPRQAAARTAFRV